ncbi:MAG: hypothetical protein IPL15_06460 [Comamonadaceae bacterium]|uniref:hypothetical protein n=1 Tax=Candidatus Skiveiella danica TaxID=3386177 RepID=UPI00390910F1|nr:hypothetical protein [Comamonadaceae bacterium]
MSQILINDYLKQLDLIGRASGSQRETIVREAFGDLLKAWGPPARSGSSRPSTLPKTATKTNIAVDGALLHELRMPRWATGRPGRRRRSGRRDHQ